MADLARIKRNVTKMVGMGAPESDIDAYIAQEGVTVDDVRAFKSEPAPELGPNVTRLQGKVSDLPSRQPSMMDAGLTAVENTIEGIPVLGPLTQRVSDFIGTQAGGLITGRDPKQLEAELLARRQGRDATFPLTALSGNLTGGIASLGGVAALPGGAAALGLEGGLGTRMANSALSGAGISMLDERARGGDAGDVLTAGGIGGGIAGAIPGIGAGLKAAVSPLTRPLAQTMRGAVNPAREAATAVGTALERDRANIAAPVLSAADEAAARFNGQPLLNIDRGGETTRALMRSAANQNPEARAIVEKTAEDRFRSQSNRAVDFFRRVMGGDVDDLARKAQIDAQARPANRAAYDAAKSDPNARAIWTPEIRQLMQSDSFRSAIKAAESRGTDVAAAQGGRAVRNPFVFREDGSVTLRQMPDGSRALPSLEFWDQVKRGLDAKIGLAKRAGDDTTAGDLMALKRTLVQSLDTAVPAYKKARGTAAAFFDAEDAVDAGKKAWSSPKALDESLAALKAMPESERKDFGIGLVAGVMDDMRAANNRQNLTRLFDVPARKELLEAALGPGKAKQLEAFVRVEDIMDKVRGSLGNSTTARQLVELGISGGLGAGAGGVSLATGGDFNSALATSLLVAAGRHGFRAVKGKVDAQVLQKVAEMLASGDKAEMSRAVANAVLSKQHMLALQAIQQGIGVASRGAAMTALN